MLRKGPAIPASAPPQSCARRRANDARRAQSRRDHATPACARTGHLYDAQEAREIHAVPVHAHILPSLAACLVNTAVAAPLAGDRAAEQLELIDWRVVTPVETTAEEERTLNLDINGEPRSLTLTPASVRAEGFTLLMPDARGELVPVAAPAPTTFRGHTDRGGRVAASLDDDGWHLLIIEDGRQWFAEPQRAQDATAARGSLVIYEGKDALAFGTCGTGDDAMPMRHAAFAPAATGTAAVKPGTDPVQQPAGLPTGQFYVTELGIDCDFPFYTLNGSSATSTMAEVERLVNAVNVVYERDVQVTFRISGVVVRSSAAANPYTATSGGGLLDQMRATWNTGGTGINHDVAHLFSGVDFDGNTIGVAFVGTVCSASRYGVNDLRFTSSLASKTALISHEMGHNFSASHCDAVVPCQIMCSGIGGCSGFGLPSFAPVSIAAIEAHAASRTCLTIGTGSLLPLPTEDRFLTATINPEVWEINNGAESSTAAFNMPSVPYALRLDANDDLQTKPVQGSATGATPTVLSFAWQSRAAAPGSRLVAEYFNRPDGRGAWVPLASATADGSLMSRFNWFDVELPAAALFDGVRLRFRAENAGTTGAWFVDNVRFGPFTVAHTPFDESFEAPLNLGIKWAVASGIGRIPASGVAGGIAGLISASSTLESHPIDMRFLATGDTVSLIARATGGSTGSLTVQLRSGAGAWQTLVTLNAADAQTYVARSAVIPFTLWTSTTAVRVVASGAASWLIDDFRAGGPALPAPPAPCPADLEAAFGVLDINDVLGFATAFNNAAPAADLFPAGGDDTFDINDVLSFAASFNAGCP